MQAGDIDARAPRRRRLALVIAILVYVLAPLLALRWRGPVPIDFWWDAFIATGLAGAGALALLPLLAARWWAARSPEADRLRVVQVLHRQLSYLLCALLLVHVLGLSVLEPRVLDYLLPTAPGYMLAGLVALLLVLALILTSLYRAQLRWAHAGWRRWHAGMSAVAVALTGWHLLGSAYWVATPAACGTSLWLLGVPTLLTLAWHRWPLSRSAGGAPSAPGGRRALGPGLAWALAGGVLLAVIVFAWQTPPDPARPPSPYPCSRGRCL